MFVIQDQIIEIFKNYGISDFTAGLALIGSLVSLWKNYQDNKNWQKEFRFKERELNQKYDEIKSKYLDILLQKRLETYPEIIRITQDLGKTGTSLEFHKKARQDLKDWIVKSHGGYLAFSKNTLDYFNKLKDLLKKNSGYGNKYSKEQLGKIFKARNDLRGSMTDDIGVIKNSHLNTTSPNEDLS